MVEAYPSESVTCTLKVLVSEPVEPIVKAKVALDTSVTSPTAATPVIALALEIFVIAKSKTESFVSVALVNVIFCVVLIVIAERSDGLDVIPVATGKSKPPLPSPTFFQILTLLNSY